MSNMAEQHSFLPEDYLEKRAQRRTNFFSLTLFVIVMAGVVGAFYVTDQQRNDVKAMQQQVNGQFEEAARRLDQFEKLQQQRQQMVRKAQVTGTLIERVPRSVLLAELINAMPLNLSLLDLDVNTKVISRAPVVTTALEKARSKKNKKSAPVYQAPETRVDIVLTGVAPTDVQVAQFMTALGNNELFSDQNLGYSEETTINGQSMRKFRVNIQLAPDTNVHEHKPTLVKRETVPNPMSDTVQINLEAQLERQSQMRTEVIPSQE